MATYWNDGTELYHNGLLTFGWNDGTELYHYGVQGMKWGVRRFQNEDGSLTDEGRRRGGYPLMGRPLAGPISSSIANKIKSKKTKLSGSVKVNKEKKGLSDNAKKALKIAGAAAVTGVAAYGAYKGVKALKDMDPTDKSVALENLRDAKQDFKNSVKNASQNVKNSTNKIKENVKEASNKIKENVKKTGESVKNKIEDEKNKIITKAQEKAAAEYEATRNELIGNRTAALKELKEQKKAVEAWNRKETKRLEKSSSGNEQFDEFARKKQKSQYEMNRQATQSLINQANTLIEKLSNNKDEDLVSYRERYYERNAGNVAKALKTILTGVEDLTIEDLERRMRRMG